MQKMFQTQGVLHYVCKCLSCQYLNKLRALIFPAFQYPIVNGREVKRSLYKNGKFICEYV